MARIYVAHKYMGDRSNIEKLGVILRKLQKEHPENTYFSPLHNFSYLDYKDLSYDDMMECCLDWLCESEKLLVVGEISEGVQREIDFAKMVDMEVEYIEPQNPGRCDEQ